MSDVERLNFFRSALLKILSLVHGNDLYLYIAVVSLFSSIRLINIYLVLPKFTHVFTFSLSICTELYNISGIRSSK